MSHLSGTVTKVNTIVFKVCMSLLQKLTFFCKSYSEPVARLVQWSKCCELETNRKHFFLYLSVRMQPRETGKPPGMTDKLFTRM